MSMLAADRSKMHRSRAKARAGLAALQNEARSERAATDAAVKNILDQLNATPDRAQRMPSLVASAQETGHARRRVKDAIFRLKAQGVVTIDFTSSTVSLRPGK